MSGWQTVMAERIIAVLVITREFTCGVDGDGDGEECQWWCQLIVMMIQQMFKPTHEKSDTQPASTLPRVLLIPITCKSYMIYMHAQSNENDQNYRHKEGRVWNWNSSDYGHVGEVHKGGVEADHGEGIGDADEEEEGVRQELEVHHLLENSKHPSIWRGEKELVAQPDNLCVLILYFSTQLTKKYSTTNLLQEELPLSLHHWGHSVS